ncbi:hypothetical protein ACH5RR_012952 [Cinchona calisaya]|uniref:Reverse transcriptase n=1 Tax=Cinchona calisaya TaxID=153742 RepID=A0ABD3A228_9GENT
MITRESAICSKLGGLKQVNQGKYLALPMVITRSKDEVFGFIREKVKKRLEGWKGKLLSQAGKEVLLKFLILALPTYVMSCFKLSRKLCKDIGSCMARFWWGGTQDNKKFSYVNWRRIMKDKEDGSLGFKDIEHFNTVLLAKQVWRLITQPNLLVSKILKAKYLNKEDIFSTEIPKNASWIWQSMISSRWVIE